jgi:hypothetical protein
MRVQYQQDISAMGSKKGSRCKNIKGKKEEVPPVPNDRGGKGLLVVLVEEGRLFLG